MVVVVRVLKLLRVLRSLRAMKTSNGKACRLTVLLLGFSECVKLKCDEPLQTSLSIGQFRYIASRAER